MRGQDVFVVQLDSFPANDHMMELLIRLDALKRASPARITAVLPDYGYARQDRKTGPCMPISAKLVANLITVAGANRVLTLDLHANQIQGFWQPRQAVVDAFGDSIGNIVSIGIVAPILKRQNGELDQSGLVWKPFK